VAERVDVETTTVWDEPRRRSSSYLRRQEEPKGSQARGGPQDDRECQGRASQGARRLVYWSILRSKDGRGFFGVGTGPEGGSVITWVDEDALMAYLAPLLVDDTYSVSSKVYVPSIA
jgi:hypothetical protein